MNINGKIFIFCSENEEWGKGREKEMGKRKRQNGKGQREKGKGEVEQVMVEQWRMEKFSPFPGKLEW